MKFIGVDYGLKRTGVAVSDPDGSMAFPRTTLVMTTREHFFAALLSLAAEEGAGAFVVGLPLHVDGGECAATVQVRHMIERLKRRTELPVYTIPEVLSSFAAEEDLRAVGRLTRADKALVDQQAAVHILQSFLDTPEERRRRA